MNPETISPAYTDGPGAPDVRNHKSDPRRPQRATKHSPSAAMNGPVRNGVTKRDKRGNTVRRPAARVGVSVPRGIARFNDRVSARNVGADAPRVNGRFTIASFGR